MRSSSAVMLHPALSVPTSGTEREDDMSASLADVTGVPWPAKARRNMLLSRRFTRLFVSLGLVATSAAVLPTATADAVSAAPVAAVHFGHGPVSAPGWGWGGWRQFRHGRYFSLSGTAGSVNDTPPGSFQLSFGPSWLSSTATTITVDATNHTFFREPGQNQPWTISGVQDGDSVQVIGAPHGPGTLTAFQVVVPLVTDTGAAGSVDTSAGTFQLSVPTPRGGGGGPGPFSVPWSPSPALSSTSTTAVDVTVSGDTKYSEPGQAQPWSLSGVQDGDTVRVVGTQGGSGAVSALLVSVPLANLSGTVSNYTPGAGGSSTFTLTPTRGSAVTVTTSSQTKISERGMTTLQDGDYVTVTGTQAGAGAVDALRILVRAWQHGGHGFGGGSGSGSGGGYGFGGGPGPGPGHHHGRR